MSGTDLTWPALLARWTAFAQSSLALPKTSDGDRWRSAVPAIINLQAVTFALGDLDTLSLDGERALAIDKADIIIRSSTGQLHALWRPDPLPSEVVGLIQDAGVALEAVRGGGIEWRVTAERLIVGHLSELMERLLELGFAGDLFIATPGVPVFAGAPAAFARDPGGAGGRPDEHVLRAVKEFLVDVTRPEPVAAFRQVYRQFDFAAGRAVRDLVVLAGPSTPPGQPLLVPAIRGGREVGVTLPPRKSADIPAHEVVFQDVSTDPQGP
ncbi:MAG TPA: hypothetical protein PKE29_08285 [Phycisphaerales bacterium]|nr:hypothetical protein [Phycisphaerales bacterium]